ncbi:efflux RND transporter periplasmic adaptor subunit [Psychroflexus tropicus]|uniref:efflux RND transporter periplasmic adaptor subunit n=1 Tax=Psychroflexus tropicus TaxID=197345 RepID=UPI0003620BCE|nr:efflux RND transporter periplasmic adaptor subunit [Psychroflexus tropicus]
MKTQYKYYLGFLLLFIIGVLIGASFANDYSKEKLHDHSQLQAEGQVWTCSMHPQIRNEEPGDCPICGMDLIPASQMDETLDPNAIKMSKTARKLAQVETIVVGSQTSGSSLNLSGRLEINQDKTSTMTANFKARIEKLYVNDEGEQVQKGQVIAELYAPEIQILKEELELANSQENEALIESIATKISNYELSINDVQSMKNGRLKLTSPVSGYVTALKVKQGDNVSADQNLMTIADLSSLWAVLDVYESSLKSIKVGDQLNITIPNEENVTGKVTFFSPVLDENSRSAKARVVIQNPNRTLKPGVFITADLYNSTSKTATEESLMIPKSALLWTGKRSVVYLQLDNKSGVYFKMIEVETGKTSSDYIEITSGLKSGDEIVSQGAFSIDSEAQLAGKPSMMNPKVEPQKIKISEESVSEQTQVVKQLINRYTNLKEALVLSDFQASLSAYRQVNSLLAELNIDDIKATEQIKTIDELREEFILLSEEMIAIAQTSNPTGSKLYVQRCPMADRGEGARWLSFSNQIKNPYYGDAMLKCGSVVDSIQ